MPPFGPLLAASVLIGLLGIDTTGAVQSMLSRPLTVGGLVGWVFGDAPTGLMAGSLVELLWVGGVPVGSLVPPDGVAAGAIAAAVAAHWGGGEAVHAEAAAALGVLAAVPVGALGARAEVIQRGLNGRLSRGVDAALEAGRDPGLGRVLLEALGLAWARGFLVGLVCLGVGLPVLGHILQHLPAEGIRALRWTFWLEWLLGLAAAANHFWDRRGIRVAALAALVVALAGSAFGLGQSRLLALVLGLAAAAGLWRSVQTRRSA